jgi:hypothetical protein
MRGEMVFIRCRQGHDFMAHKVLPETGPAIQQLVCPKCGAAWEQLVPDAVELERNPC